MLYATTRDKIAGYTAQQALKDERAPDGGIYMPEKLPVFSREELDALLKEPEPEIIARVLNLFFDGTLGRLDVEFEVGRRIIGMARISHRIVIGELWRNPEGGFEGLCSRLTQRLCTEGTAQKPGTWMRIACRVALIFAIFSRLRREGILADEELLDVAALAGDFESPYALHVTRNMGLPIGEIICCCNANAGLWELFSFGQLKTSAKVAQTMTPLCDRVVPAALELLIRERLHEDDVMNYFDALERGGNFFLEPEAHQRLREGFSASVVSDRRMRLAIPNLYNTNGYILGPYSALAYTGLMDYRSHPGPRRTALMLTEHDPRENADIVTRALVLSSEELDQWCQHG